MSAESQEQGDNRAQRRQHYWRRNLRLVVWLLATWFAVSYGAGILWVDELDEVRIAGFKLGFWFAQQGSILVFVLLVAIYVQKMKRLDSEYDDSEDPEP